MATEPRPREPRLSREGARAVDRAALVECGVPSYVLMEHAGRSIVELVFATAWPARCARPTFGSSASEETSVGTSAPPHASVRVAVVCGGGNNGGDGFVIARFLKDVGADVIAYAVSPASRTRGDALLARGIAARCGVEIVPLATASDVESARARARTAPFDVVIDALLGTGFQGVVRADGAAAIRLVNEWGAREGTTVVSVDVPSGLDADTGGSADPTVRAHVTGTFVARKIGFDAPAARASLGNVHVLPIGAPASIASRAARE